MLQTDSFLSFIGFALIFVGFLLLVIGMTRRMTRSSSDEEEQECEQGSRGVILIGPIPIVWGFGNRGRLIMVLLFAIMMVVWLLLLL